MSFSFNFALDGGHAASAPTAPLAVSSDTDTPIRKGERFVWSPTSSLPSFSTVEVGDLTFQIVNTLHPDFLMHTGAISCILTKSDVQKGVYEGGFKLWECAIDLVQFVESQLREGKIVIPHSVLELGCGHGLPGIHALQRGAQRVVFSDYNKEVLELTTCPNVSKNISEYYSKAEFYAGAWSSMSNYMKYIEKQSDDQMQFDLILTAETIYTEEVAIELYETIKRHLRRSKDARALVAAKKYYFGTNGSVQHFVNLVKADNVLKAEIVWQECNYRSNIREIEVDVGGCFTLNLKAILKRMEGPPVGCIALTGAGYDLNKTQSNRLTRSFTKISRSRSSKDRNLPIKVPSVDALLQDLRKALHAMYQTTNSISNAYEYNSRQAFQFFTTTNTITQECFLHKVVRLGLQATPRLCNELFRRIDQKDLGEIDYATFAHRIFLPETFYSPEKPSSPVIESLNNFNPTPNHSPRSLVLKDSNAENVSSKLTRHEYMTLDELQVCIARKLEEKMPRGSSDFIVRAFQFFTNVETITFVEFHRHLDLLQIRITPSKCRELFLRFDKDGDGVIDTLEFVTTLFPKDYRSLTYPNNAKLSDNELSMSTKQIVGKVREKMDELLEETDKFQQAYILFGKTADISRSDLNTAMRKLGLKLSEKQVQDMFATFDFDKTGDLDVSKFVQGVMLDDNSTSFWLSVKDRQKVDNTRRKLYSMAVASVQQSWTIADIERMLREKIEQHTSRSSDCFRQAFRIFKKVNGIKPDEFHAALEAIGLALTRLQSDILFCRFDKNGSGDIDLNEFIHGVLPPDYTGISWVAAADEMHRIEAKKKKEEAMANPNQYMTEIEMESWSLDEIETRIRDKIQQTTSRSSDTFRQAFKIFKKARHVTMDEFRERLLALGFRLTPDQCRGLFKRYDTDKSNDLDLQEFCLKILPPDYTHDGDHWSHSEKFKKESQRQKLDYVKRSKNGLIMLPKFIEAHRFSRGHRATRLFQKKLMKEAQPTDKCKEGNSMSDGTRPSTSSSIVENSIQPLIPRPPSVSRPLSVATESCGLQHSLSPRHSIGRIAPILPTDGKSQGSCTSRNIRVADSPTHATPPPSARMVSLSRPISPRVVDSLASPQSSSPSRLNSPKASEPAIGYEDEEILVDECKSQDLAQAKLMSPNRRRLGTPNRHQRFSIDPYTSNQDLIRPAETVAECSTSSSGGALKTAKHMPQRNHVLLIKRLMQAAKKRAELKNGKRLNCARR
ncbi:putative calcium binding protein [Plasmopara halstedii]